MIDISSIKYKLMLYTQTGSQLDITSIASDIGWEEGEGELATRTNISMKNALYGGSPISSIAKPGCMIVTYAETNISSDEVARGCIVDWDPYHKGSETSSFDVTAYDELFNLQQSQDDRYYPAGTSTKTAILNILKDWNIPIDKYEGPNIAHAKSIFKAEYLSDILIQLLDEAVKKGAPKCFFRATGGKVSVLQKGSNNLIYHFGEDNSVVTRDKISTSELVTRVKIVGNENNDGRRPIEAIINGQTQYGIKQRIYNRPSDDKLAAAKAAAQEIIDNQGKPTRNITLEGPDVPFMRKGDKIHANTGTLNGYFYLKSVRHNATNKSMSMDLEPA